LLIARRRQLSTRSVSIAVMIVVGLILQLLMLRLPGDTSLWWAVWRLFPGASGLRAVARLEILVTLAMGLAFGSALDQVLASSLIARMTSWRRRLAATCAVVLVSAGALEQIGRVQGYSGAGAEALSRDVSRALPPTTCTAAYVVSTPDLVTQQQAVDEAHFDPQAYLIANPDVAESWRGTPWEHYVKFGRAEQRLLDPVAANRHVALMYFAYNYTILLAASLSGVPVVNGLSGWQPPGWHLFDVLAPHARQWLAEWLTLRGVKQDAVCVVPVRLTTEMIPDLPEGMLP
jgi:hypothetical protein